MDYNDLNEEDRLLEQEQENKGQKTDLFDVASNVNDINNRIQRSKMSKSNAELGEGASDLAPNPTEVGGSGTTGATTAGAGEVGTTAAETAAGGTATAGTAAAETAAAGTAAGGTAAAGTAAATAGTAAAGTAAATAGTAAVAASPVGWIILAAIILIIVIIIFVLLFESAGNAFSESTGMPEEYLVGNCEEDDTKCLEVNEYMTNKYPNFGEKELYEQMILTCEEQKTFGEKIEDFFERLFGIEGDEVIKEPCDLMEVIEKYVAAKEDKVGVTLSRGMVVGTLQWLYNGRNDLKDAADEESEDPKSVNTSSPNAVLSNVAAAGIVTAKDIKAIVEYVAYKESYTYYTWGETYRNTEYDCKTKTDYTGTYKYDCKILIKYGCIPEKKLGNSASNEKYFIFLKYGGVGSQKFDEKIQKMKMYWNTIEVGKDNDDGMILETKQETTEGLKYDPATSYQEITSYNKAYMSTSDECKIEGEAEKSLPKSTKTEIYILEDEDNEKMVTTGLHAFPTDDVIDTTAYETTPESGKVTANVLGLNCKLNNIKYSDSDSVICKVQQGELYYGNGFMYNNYPQYKYSNDEAGVDIKDFDDEQYKKLGQSMESQIQIVDEYEDFVNEIFGFEISDMGNLEYYTGIDGANSYGEYYYESLPSMKSSCNFSDNMPIRLMSCTSCSASTKQASSFEFPGGASEVDGRLVANDTITMEEYIKGTTYREMGSYKSSSGKTTTTKLEAIKFGMIMIHSYLIAETKTKVINNEFYVPIDGCCFQAYRSSSHIPKDERATYDEAWSEIKETLLFLKGSSSVFRADYGNKLQTEIGQMAEEGLSYTEMLGSDYVQNYTKGDLEDKYSEAEFGTCTDLGAGGEYNGSVQTSWPLFANGKLGSANYSTMFICRKNSGNSDFHAAVDIAVAAGTEVVSPLDGKVISSNWYECGNGIVKVQGTIPGTTETVVMQFTHMNSSRLIANNSTVKANVTVLGTIATGQNDTCSSGSHLDFKVYNPTTNKYYNPSVFMAGIMEGNTNIPQSSFINGYNGGNGPNGYDECCVGRIGNLPSC